MHTHSPVQRDGSLPASRQAFAHPRRNVGALRIQAGMRVADFGSGSGAYVLAVAERLEGTGHVYAIDVQKDLLRRISNDAQKRGYKNVEIIWGDLESPNGSKLASSSIDVVLISNLLFQIPDKAPVLEEARRIVKTTGHVTLIDWVDSFRGMGPQQEDVVTKDMALSLARSAGLELVQEFEAGAHHWGLVFRPIKK